MSRIVKFNPNGDRLTCISEGEKIWFKGNDAAEALGYADPKGAIRRHVKVDERKVMVEPRGRFTPPRGFTYINDPGLYRLVFGSKLESAEKFKTWVFNEVLPSIRKTGRYTLPTLKDKQIRLLTEYDLHTKVVEYIRRFHPNLIMVAGLGELQDTASKRISAYKKCYKSGQPDIMINNFHKKYAGFASNLKPQTEKAFCQGHKLIRCRDTR